MVPGLAGKQPRLEDLSATRYVHHERVGQGDCAEILEEMHSPICCLLAILLPPVSFSVWHPRHPVVRMAIGGEEKKLGRRTRWVHLTQDTIDAYRAMG